MSCLQVTTGRANETRLKCTACASIIPTSRQHKSTVYLLSITSWILQGSLAPSIPVVPPHRHPSLHVHHGRLHVRDPRGIPITTKARRIQRLPHRWRDPRILDDAHTRHVGEKHLDVLACWRTGNARVDATQHHQLGATSWA